MAKIYFGPYHPAYKEPLGIILEVEGEKVIDAEISIGYAHREIEKILEECNWVNGMAIASKICGICSCVHNNTYCQGVERIFGVEIPERAKYIRMIVLELERVQSHLLWLGTMMHEIGYETLFMIFWGDREKILEFAEKFSGRRIAWMVSIPGGVRRDIKGKLAEELKKLINYFRKRWEFYREILTKDETILVRLKNVGILEKEKAKEYCVVGPVARASGLKRDIRFEDPYLFYEESPYEIILGENGDCFDRMMVRLKEIKISLDIIEWALENMKGKEISKKISPFQKPPEGEAISRMEAPRGELFYYFRSDGDIRPKRVRIRTPTFANIPTILELLKDVYLADVPAIVFSYDPCIACMDRVLIIKNGKEELMTRKELVEYSKKWFKRNFERLKRERLCS